ncbi:uncharacterized protein LOC134247477 isoform X2 [Saccostrea cucullata]
MDLALYLIVIASIFLFLVIFFLCIWWIVIISSKRNQKAEIGILSIFLASTLAVVGFMIFCYSSLDTVQGKNEEMNFETLHTNMKSSLTGNFVSDNIKSENETSNQWSRMLIEYKCCGVNTVFGTTNDFDTTPWCTTNGSCQLTNSQIPKSCCLGVISEDLQSAHDDCHAKVTQKTYNEKGCFLTVKEKLLEKKEQQRLKIKGVLEEEIKVFPIMGICVLLQIFGIIRSACKIGEEDEEDEEDSEHANRRNQTEDSNNTNGIMISPL